MLCRENVDGSNAISILHMGGQMIVTTVKKV